MDTAEEWVRREPAPALRGLIDEYVGYRLAGLPPTLHRGLPSRHMTFIISIGAPIDVVRQTDSAQSPERYRTVISGLQASSALIAHSGEQEGVAIGLSPLGSAALLHLPAAELWDLSAEASAVDGSRGEELWERLQHAASWEARFAACDHVLLGWLGGQRTPEAVAHGWEALVTAGGLLSVDELARRAGYSRQHFTRLFRRELGLGPKAAGRVVRFDRAARLLRSGSGALTLAEVALACGYADQAHLCREVAQLAGCSPGQLIAGDVPIA